MFKYPRRFKFRHTPAIRPNVRPRRYRFEFYPDETKEVAEAIYGGPIQTVPSFGALMASLRSVDFQIRHDISNVRQEQQCTATHIIHFMRFPSICPKLASFFKLKKP